MIRWNAPDIFAQADGFAAVIDPHQNWTLPSIQAFRPLFLHVSLPSERCFNNGIVLLGERQLPAVRAFIEFSLRHWRELKAVIESGHFWHRPNSDEFRFSSRARVDTSPSTCVQCFPLLSNGPIALCDRT